MQCRRAHGVWGPGVDFGWGGVVDVEREAQKIDTDKARTQMASVAGKAASLPLVGKGQETTGHPE